MRVLLVAPPVASPFYPPLGLPSLAAFIRRNSNHTCAVADVSLEAMRHVLSKQFIANCRDTLDTRVKSLEFRTSLSVAEQKQYGDAVDALVRSRSLPDGIGDAVSCFQALDRFQNRQERQRSIRTLDAALSLVSAAHHPFNVSTGDLTCEPAPYSLDAVLNCVRHFRSPFCAFVEQRLATLIADHQPDVVGVSINYFGQLIGALEVLRHIRRVFPKALTVIGGGLMPEIATTVVDHPELGKMVDYAICYEGETALLSLLDELAAAGREGADPAKVPNLVRRSRRKVIPLSAAGRGNASANSPATRVTRRHREDVHSLPEPDFSDLPLRAYLSPEPVIPLLTSRGCYWGACAFCTHFHTYGDDYRTGTGVEIVDAMQKLSARYGTSRFYFVDESLAPSKARAISEELILRGLTMSWGTELRFEQSLNSELIRQMAAAGCRVLSFGLESGSQRVLDAMDKGIRVEDVHRILDDLHGAAIHAHVMCIVGFPGETLADVEATLSIVRQHKRALALVGFSPFTLNVNSIVHRSPDRFGIVVGSHADPFRPDVNFTIKEGLGQVEAAELYEKIASSPDIVEIDEACSTATREHLLFLSPSPNQHTHSETATPSPARFTSDAAMATTFSSSSTLLTLGFKLSEARLAGGWAKAAKRSRLYDAPPPPAPPSICRTTTKYAYVEESQRLFELSDELAEIVRSCANSTKGSSLLRRICAGNRDTASIEAATAILHRLCSLGVLRMDRKERTHERRPHDARSLAPTS